MKLRISGHGLVLLVGSYSSFFPFQEQEDPNKLATSWPDYYIDRINSMAAVSGCPLLAPQGRAVRWMGLPLSLHLISHPTPWGSAVSQGSPRNFNRIPPSRVTFGSPNHLSIW